MKSVKIIFKDDVIRLINEIINYESIDGSITINCKNGNVIIYNIDEIKSMEFTNQSTKQILHG